MVWSVVGAGDAIRPIARLNDTGGEAVLLGDGTVRIGAVGVLSAEWSKRVARAWRTGEVDALPEIGQALAGVRGAPVVLDGSASRGERPVALDPVGAAVRAGGRPVSLRWHPIAGSPRQRVVVLSSAGGEWAEELAGGAGQVELPAGAFLHPGRKYTWQIESGPAAGQGLRLSEPASFFVLPADGEAALTRLEREFGGSALALAAVYQACGLRGAALAQLERLSHLNPADATVARWHAALAGRP